ncbi:MAG: DUF2293 domain-containing protein [Desulfobacterales bacterium]|nr:MAG: DUF2293 domain-containing protein [Desulfobacterales bacterium]
MSKGNDIVVFISTRNSTCGECKQELGRRAWITLDRKRNALCLNCADLDHLVFLPSGDAALTRRSRKYSGLSAVVVKWSRARKRYERQGLLVEEEALERAEKECAVDDNARKLARARAAARRAELDLQYIRSFAGRVRQIYRFCPTGRERLIAEHACRKYSGRVGRSAATKALDEEAVRLAVTAHVRHAETNYDDLLLKGIERWEAREKVYPKVHRILDRWEHGESQD